MFAFDIETVPLTAALAVPFDPSTVEVPSNYKNPEAIEKYVEKARVAWGERRVKACSLNPRLGRIAAIGFADARGEHAVVAMTEDEEDAPLLAFWERARRAAYPDEDEPFTSLNSPQLVTWNGAGFDLRFVLTRTLLRGIDPGVHPDVIARWMRRYDLRAHFDVKAALLQHDPHLMRDGDEGLDAWATAFGLDVKPSHGSEVYGMVQRGERAALEEYATHDARVTWQLFVRASAVYGGGA